MTELTRSRTAQPPGAALSAWLLLAVIGASLAAEAWTAWPDWLAGAIAWAAALPLWVRLSRRQRAMVGAMLVLGAAGIVAGLLLGEPARTSMALTLNTPIIAMLAGVAFLPLVSVREPSQHDGSPPRRGRLALAQTLVGVHLFGAVINLTAALIAGDRLRRGGALPEQQAMAVGTAFSVSAFWSPFLGAMAVSLTVAKGASLLTLVAMGLPLAAAGLLLLWVHLSRARFEHARDFEGYPLDLRALWVPVALALGVFLVHEWQPGWSVLPVIASLALAITAGGLIARGGAREAAVRLARFVPARLPGMAGELWVFLAAAVLAAGLSAVLAALEIGAPFARFGGLEACLVLLLCTVTAWLGLHTVVSIPLVGVWLAPLSPDPNLLACAFLCSWAIGLPACATSGTVLTMQARYGIPASTYVRWNLPYLVSMLAVCMVALNFYAWRLPGG